jgi:hypothetical protein
MAHGHEHLGHDSCKAFLSRVSHSFVRYPPTPGARSPLVSGDVSRFNAIAGKSAVEVFAGDLGVLEDPVLTAAPGITASKYAHVKNYQMPGSEWADISNAFCAHGHLRPPVVEVCQRQVAAPAPKSLASFHMSLPLHPRALPISHSQMEGIAGTAVAAVAAHAGAGHAGHDAAAHVAAHPGDGGEVSRPIVCKPWVVNHMAGPTKHPSGLNTLELETPRTILVLPYHVSCPFVCLLPKIRLRCCEHRMRLCGKSFWSSWTLIRGRP